MSPDTDPGSTDPTAPAARAPNRSRWWTHHHATFVLAVFTRYRINLYGDRKAHRGSLGDGIESWSDDDRQLAIEEGRRQLDEQRVQLQYLTRRASALLPVGLAVTAFLLTALDDLGMLVQPARTIARVLLLLGPAMTIWGTLVMGALIAGRASFMKTDALQLTHESADLREHLARDYAENVGVGENTNVARLTHLGTGVVWIVIGAIVGAAGLLVIHW
ncbi:hypothetical protein [Candidatus Poriferisodalis sp.]|uniref:hypothetical protein n=1 Tax=Candidatus Poriferisodalis sp. TaxID=3101277 RepID=UPI003B01313B